MSHEGAENIMYDLVAKQLAGETTGAEDREIALWVEVSEENVRAYKHFRQMWDASKTSDWQPNVDRVWARMRTRMHSDEPPVIKIERRSNKVRTLPMWRIAAAVVVLFATVWFVRDALRSRPADYHDWSKQVSAVDSVRFESLKEDSEMAMKPSAKLYVANDFGRRERAVALEGEARFTVAKNPEKPFRVQAAELTIEVLGTEFIVNSYPDSSFVSVAVSEGLVAVMSSRDALRLTPGDAVRFDRGTGVIVPQRQKPDAFFRSNRSLDFRRTPLDEVVATLNRNYQSNLVLANPLLANCRLTANFNDQQIADIVEVLAATLNLEVRKETTTWIIEGAGCSPEL